MGRVFYGGEGQAVVGRVRASRAKVWAEVGGRVAEEREGGREVFGR